MTATDASALHRATVRTTVDTLTQRANVSTLDTGNITTRQAGTNFARAITRTTERVIAADRVVHRADPIVTTEVRVAHDARDRNLDAHAKSTCMILRSAT
jgi:hypothetical protein